MTVASHPYRPLREGDFHSFGFEAMKDATVEFTADGPLLQGGRSHERSEHDRAVA